MRRLLLGLVLIAAISQLARAQEATQPAAPPRYELVVPEGFETIDVDGRRAVTTPGDAAWVRDVLRQVKPTTRPTTMPADVVERAMGRRAAVVEGLARDLVLADTQAVAAMYDQQLLPHLRQIETADVPLFYFVADSAAVKERLKAGWSDPRFRYNRSADDVMINQRLEIVADRPMDDTLLPVLYDAGATDDAKRQKLREAVEAAEQGVIQELSKQAQVRVQYDLITFAERSLLDRFEYKSDQVWFRLGVSAVLASRYASQITGTDEMHYLVPMVLEPRGVRVRAASVDLLNPTEPGSLRPEFVAGYMDALRRKSIAAVFDWAKTAPDGSIPKVIRAITETKPEDGEALVKLIQEQTGVGMSENLRPTP